MDARYSDSSIIMEGSDERSESGEIASVLHNFLSSSSTHHNDPDRSQQHRKAPVMSHSKRNTSRAFFTSHERSQLKGWGSQSARISADQSLPFGSCALCLLPAKDPVACSGYTPQATTTDEENNTQSGQKRKRRVKLSCHIFCRECAITNLLAQKKELKRLEALRAAAEEAKLTELAVREEEAEALALQDFERTQAGFTSHGQAFGEDAGKRKRGKEFDQADAEREQKRTAMERLLADEAMRKRDKKMPSFWLPGEAGKDSISDNTPDADAKNKEEKKTKDQTFCPGGEGLEKHSLNLKGLVPIAFSEEGESAKDLIDGKIRVCPACSKPLNNASRAVLGKPCGHIVCGNCCTKFVLTGVDDDEAILDDTKEVDIACFVCGESLTEDSDLGANSNGKERRKKKGQKGRGLMEISCEGTGFASAGKSQVKSKGTAFSFG